MSTIIISKETAEKVYRCHREIETGEQLLLEIRRIVEAQKHDRKEPTLRDAFGRERTLQLGVPTGEDSHRLFDVSWSLAEPIIQAHIAHKRAELELISQAALSSAA